LPSPSYDRYAGIFNRTSFILLLCLNISLLGIYLLSQIEGLRCLAIINLPLGIISLIILPGFALFKLLNIKKIDNFSVIIFSSALGFAYCMILYSVVNAILLKINIPIFEFLNFFIINFTSSIILHCISVRYGHEFTIRINAGYFTIRNISLITLPIIAIISAFLFNRFSISALNYFVIMIVCLIILGSVIGLISRTSKAAVLYVLGLSLLLLTSLLSNFPVEWADISFEYWVGRRSVLSGNWDYTYPDAVNAMASMGVLIPSLSIMTQLNLPLVFKFLMPFFFALVPVGVYEIAKTKVSKTVSFLSAILILSSSVFFTEMQGLIRQQIAELLLISVILIFIQTSVKKQNKILFILFIFPAISMSHYTISALISLILIICIIILYLEKITVYRKVQNGFQGLKDTITISTVSLIILVISSIIWFTLVADGIIFESFLQKITQSSILTGVNDSENSAGDNIFQILSGYNLWLMGIFSLLSLIGLIVYNNKNNKSIILYAFAVWILFTSIFFRFGLSYWISAERVFHISSLVLSPFLVYGLCTALNKSVTRLHFLRHIDLKKSVNLIPVIISILIIIQLVVGSGFISILGEEYSKMDITQNVDDRPLFTEQEWQSSLWAFSYTGPSPWVYGDAHTAYLLAMNLGSYHPYYGNESLDFGKVRSEKYHVLGEKNLEGTIILENFYLPRLDKHTVEFEINNYLSAMPNATKIYCSAEVNIYLDKY